MPGRPLSDPLDQRLLSHSFESLLRIAILLFEVGASAGSRCQLCFVD